MGQIEPVTVARLARQGERAAHGAASHRRRGSQASRPTRRRCATGRKWIATPQHTAKMPRLLLQRVSSRARPCRRLQRSARRRAGRHRCPPAREPARELRRTRCSSWQEGQPFTSTMTTRRFMLTPRLMMLYAYLDAIQVNDSGGSVDLFAGRIPASKFTLTAKSGVIPLSETLDRKSRNYMIFYAPQLNRRRVRRPVPAGPPSFTTAATASPR